MTEPILASLVEIALMGLLIAAGFALTAGVV
jgi:hypothetical protein